jgi:hypothetical protein
VAERVGVLSRTRVFTPKSKPSKQSLEFEALASSSSCAVCLLLALVFVLYQRDVTRNVTRIERLGGPVLAFWNDKQWATFGE